MSQGLQIDNIMATDAVEELGEIVIAAVVVDELLDLRDVELSVGEDGVVGGEGTEDTIAAEKYDAVFVLLHRAHEVINVGIVPDEARIILMKRQLEVVGEGAVTTYGGERHYGHDDKANHKPEGWLGRDLHDEVSETDNCCC